MFVTKHVGVFSITDAQIVFCVEIKAFQIAKFYIAPEDMGGRGQSIFEAHSLQVSDILHVSFRLRYQEQHRLPIAIDLAI